MNWIFILLTVNFLQCSGDATDSSCKKFKDVSKETFSHQCSIECSSSYSSTKVEVWGTEIYHEDSYICLAAKHVGVISSDGGRVKYKHAHNVRKYVGTLINRIISGHKIIPIGSQQLGYTFTSEKYIPQSLNYGNIIVHRETQERQFFCYHPPDTEIEIKNTGMKEIEGSTTKNPFQYSVKNRLSRCIGDNYLEDVYALKTKKRRGGTRSREYPVSITKSVGDTLNLDLSFLGYTRRFPGEWLEFHEPESIMMPNQTPLSIKHGGLYLFDESNSAFNNDTKRKISENGHYLSLHIRNCPADKYGSKCDKICPDCLNGGVCHPLTGDCICAPGYNGIVCEQVCPNNKKFGKNCEISLPEKFRLHSTIFCLLEPYGCTCGRGFKGFDCSQFCNDEEYGPGCAYTCHYCQNKKCDNNGRCKEGCINNVACDEKNSTLNLPRLRSYPIVFQKNGYLAVEFEQWEQDTDDGKLPNNAKIINYIISITGPSTQHSAVVAWKNELLYRKDIDVSNMHGRYDVIVLVNTTRGLASEITNHRILKTTTWICRDEKKVPQISDLSCNNNKYSSQITCIITLGEQCRPFKLGEEIMWTLTPKYSKNCNSPVKILKKITSLQGDLSIIKENFYFLAGYTDYEITAHIISQHGSSEKKKAKVKTKSKRVSGNTQEYFSFCKDGKYRLYWNSPCPEESKVVKFNIDANTVFINETLCTESFYQHCYSNTTGHCDKILLSAVNEHGEHHSEVSFTLQSKYSIPPPLVYTKSKTSSTAIIEVQEGKISSVICTLTSTDKSIHVDKLSKVNGNTRYELSRMKPYTNYTFIVFCNSRESNDASPPLFRTITTSHAPVEDPQNVKILKSTDNSVTIQLPALPDKNDKVNTSFIIINDRRTYIPEDVEYSLFYKHSISNPTEYNICHHPVYIAGVYNETFASKNVTIGRGVHHCQFDDDTHFTVLLEYKSVDEINYEEIAVKSEDGSSIVLWIIFLLLVLIISVLMAIYFVNRINNGVTTDRESFIKYINPNERNIELNTKTKEKSLHKKTSTIAHTEPEYYNIIDIQERDELEVQLRNYINSPTLEKEFKKVPRSFNKAMTYGTDPVNKTKNRYKNILPYDDTRVCLSNPSSERCSDYINANYIESYCDKKIYIASQGPISGEEGTIGDFWHMIIENEISHILMLANFIESGKEKVGKYYNATTALNIDTLSVNVIEQKIQDAFIMSEITVTYNNIEHHIYHYQFTAWPDHGIPANTRDIQNMIKHVTDYATISRMVIHCSAGIGRTGTILTTFFCLDLLLEKFQIDPINVLIKIRTGRPLLVEDTRQFNFALKVFEAITYADKYEYELNKINILLQQKHELSNSYWTSIKNAVSHSTYEIYGKKAPQKFCRDASFVPTDSSAIFLSYIRNDETSQYVNAMNLSLACKDNAFITTEHPLPHTIDRFWRLVWEKKCRLIILLQQTEENLDFIPSTANNTQKNGEFVVELVESQDDESEICCYNTLRISDDGNRTTRDIQVFIISNCNEKYGAPDNSRRIISVCNYMTTTKISSEYPLLITCWDGKTGVRLTLAMIDILTIMKIYSRVNIYATSLNLYRQVPQFLPSKDQMVYLIDSAVVYYIDYLETYGNF